MYVYEEKQLLLLDFSFLILTVEFGVVVSGRGRYVKKKTH